MDKNQILRGIANGKIKEGRVSDSAPESGSVPSVELTKLLDVWSKRADEDCVPNDFNRGLQKAFQICSDGLRRKMEQNENGSV